MTNIIVNGRQDENVNVATVYYANKVKWTLIRAMGSQSPLRMACQVKSVRIIFHFPLLRSCVILTASSGQRHISHSRRNASFTFVLLQRRVFQKDTHDASYV